LREDGSITLEARRWKHLNQSSSFITASVRMGTPIALLRRSLKTSTIGNQSNRLIKHQPMSAGRFRSCELRACIRMRTEQYGCRTDAQTHNLSEVTDVRISQKPLAGGVA
jgi:hypothetical protein